MLKNQVLFGYKIILLIPPVNIYIPPVSITVNSRSVFRKLPLHHQDGFKKYEKIQKPRFIVQLFYEHKKLYLYQ